MMETKIKLKKEVLSIARQQQAEKVAMLKKAMDDAQESANESTSGIEDRFESFKEQCQIDRDMFARRWQEAGEVLSGLTKLAPEPARDIVGTGAMVVTERGTYLIGGSVGEVKVEGQSYFVISRESPVYQLMEGKTKGDRYVWAGEEAKIKDVF